MACKAACGVQIWVWFTKLAGVVLAIMLGSESPGIQ